MQLVELPSELLLSIINHLGSQFFRHDTRRLTLFKRWYPLAWLVFASELELTVPSLQKFLQNESAFALIQQHLSSVTLSLDLGTSPPTPSITRRGHEAPPPRSIGIRSIDISSLLEASKRIQPTTPLLNLADKLQGCPSLHTLRLFKPASSQAQGSYLVQTQPLAALLRSARHLTTLEIDIASIAPYFDGGAERPHLCVRIHALLPTLRRLHCRLGNVCECLLDAETLPQSLVRLEEVIVNLNLSDTKMALAAARCLPQLQGPFRPLHESASARHLRPSLEEQAVALARRMARPRVVRVVSWRGSPPGVVSFDALTLRRMRLAAGAAWDADGEVIGEGVAEN